MRKIISILLALSMILALNAIATPVAARIAGVSVYLDGNCACQIGVYNISFTTEASLTEGVHSVCVKFPADTTVPATGSPVPWSTGDIVMDGVPVFGSEVKVTGTEVCFIVPVDFDAGTHWVQFKSGACIVNPCTANFYYLEVYTSRDPDKTPVKNAVPYRIKPCYSSYTFVWDSGPTYPGIAADFVPPFRVGETHAFNLIFEPYSQGCNAPCASPVDIVMSLVVSPQFPCGDLDPVAKVTVNLTGPAGTWAGVLTWNECEGGEPPEVTIYDNMPLAANTTYTWQGLIRFDTVGEYTICFKVVCPGVEAGPCTSPVAPGGENMLVQKCFGSDTDQWLDAEAEEGYCSANQTGDVDAVADTEDASTTNSVANTENATTTNTVEDGHEITADFETVRSAGCFIATAAYGTPIAAEIQILRDFRDKYLLTSPLGRELVDVYYGISPPIAEFITEHPSLKPIVRAGLMPIVAVCSIVLEMVPEFAGNET